MARNLKLRAKGSMDKELPSAISRLPSSTIAPPSMHKRHEASRRLPVSDFNTCVNAAAPRRRLDMRGRTRLLARKRFALTSRAIPWLWTSAWP
jgi:hypothetical protein